MSTSANENGYSYSDSIGLSTYSHEELVEMASDIISTFSHQRLTNVVPHLMRISMMPENEKVELCTQAVQPTKQLGHSKQNAKKRMFSQVHSEKSTKQHNQQKGSQNTKESGKTEKVDGWTKQPPRKPNKQEIFNAERWEVMFKKLAEFQKANGHCQPTEHDHPRCLNSWVHSQRSSYTNNTLSLPRFKKLNELGFKWERKFAYDIAGMNPEQAWDFRYNQLKEYYEENGTSDIPRSQYTPLTRWCSAQCDKYSKNKLSRERIDKLNALNFPWQKGAKRGEELNGMNAKDLWDYRMKQIVAYKEEFGTTNVPKNDRDDPYYSLGKWAGRLRYLYNRNTLPEERVRELDDIGFWWGRGKRSDAKDANV